MVLISEITMSYTTYLFDFDYTLANSSRGIVICFRNVLTRRGYTEITDDDIKRTIGKTLEDSFSLLTRITDAEQLAILKTEYGREADTYMTVNTVLFEETQAVLTILKKRGAKLGIISTKYRFRILELLNQHFPEDFFDIIVGGEDVTEHKPSPEGLLYAINQLHCAREETLYIGDSTIDAETAQAAGIDFAGVTHGMTTAMELAVYPHIQIMNSLEGLLDDNEVQTTQCEEGKPVSQDEMEDAPTTRRGEKRINIGQGLILLLLLFLSIREMITEGSLILLPVFLLTLWGILQKRRMLPLRIKTSLASRFHRHIVLLRAFHFKIIRGQTPPAISEETNICRNCGATYIGNYCNRCGQSRNTPRYNMSNALRHIAGGFFNIDNGFGHTLIDLLHRPGYMISDFIGGKRASYFRPFQTLFVLAAVYIMIVQLIDPDALSKKNIFKPQENHYAATAAPGQSERTDTISLNLSEEPKDSTGILFRSITNIEKKITQSVQNSPLGMRIWNLLKSWTQGNKAFHIIVTLPLFAVSTRFVFRRKKYQPKYNTTEHIFIQTYIACQILLLSIIVLPLHGYAQINKLYDLPLWGIFTLFCWDYKQLYRCSWWSSFWRTALMFLFSSLILILIAILATFGVILLFDTI